MNIFPHQHAKMHGRSSSACAAVPVDFSGSVDAFVARRSRELDRWYMAIRVMLAVMIAGYVSVDVLQPSVAWAPIILLGSYFLLNVTIWLVARRSPASRRWAFAGADVAVVVILRHFFVLEVLVDPNATMVGFFTFILLIYTAYGDPMLSRAISLSTIAVTAATIGMAIVGSAALQTGVLSYQKYPLRMFVVLVYLSSFGLLTYGLALKLREYVLEYGMELHRRIEAAMTSTAERTRREKLEELNRLKRDFISILSHELRTPLAPLRSSLEMMHGQSGSRADDRELLGIALESTEKLQRLVQDYTQLAELLTCEGTGMIRWNMRLSTMIDALRDQGVLTRVDTDGLENLVVVAEPKLLAGALLALIRRATLVTSPTCRISMRGFATDREVVLEIHDPESYLERDISEMLDDPFVVSSERTFVSGSTGLELILARHSLHRIGGKLHVSSDPYEGTTISCAVPAMQRGVHWLSDAQLRFELEPLRLHTAA